MNYKKRKKRIKGGKRKRKRKERSKTNDNYKKAEKKKGVCGWNHVT